MKEITGRRRRKSDSIDVRRSRLINLYGFLAAAFLVPALFLIWALRELAVPIILGALVAYLAIPLVRGMQRKQIPRLIGILTLFLVFSLLVFSIVSGVGDLLQDEKRRLVWRVVSEYKINRLYQDLMGLNAYGGGGNALYRFAGRGTDRLVDRVNDLLYLPHELRMRFRDYREGYHDIPPVSDKVWEYYLVNTRYYKRRLGQRVDDLEREGKSEQDIGADSRQDHSISISGIGGLLSVWVTTPLVFLFLLFDNGRIVRSFIGLFPNRYFEPAHIVIRDVHLIIGSYLRGVLTQCSLLALSLAILLFLVGLPLQWVFLISGVVGLTNVIPFLGPLMGLAAGVGYALVEGKVDSYLPYVTENSLVLWILGCICVVQLFDNFVLQPLILGRAVQLHPFAVIMGVIIGSILMGITGMLLAIPTIVIVREILRSLFHQLKAYYII